MNNLHKLIGKALSEKELLKALKGKCRILKYSELYKHDNIDSCMKDGCLIILYELEPDSGHWCCITKHKDELEFFDPYGLLPDSEQEWVPKDFKHISKQDFPYLSLLMYASPYKLFFNEHKLQSDNKNSSTCGRWCLLRCLLKDMPLNKFVKLFKDKDLTPDEIATILTQYA